MTKDAGALHCPNCGGPASPGDAACKYCRAALATVSCPTCFALMFEGAVYCPSCGTRRARREEGSGQEPCPSCRGVMREVRVGDTTLLECARCHGLWVDAATFEQVCASHEAQAAVLSPFAKPPSLKLRRPGATGDKHQSTAAATRPSAEIVRYRKCVACGKMMNRLNFGKLSGAVVDVCKGHGTFLDTGELHVIVKFIQAGGLDRARQRQIEDLKDAEKLRNAPKPVRPTGSVQAAGDSLPWEGGVDVVSFLLEHLMRK